MPHLEVAPARVEELPLVMKIIDEAAQWLLARGIRQWESPPPLEAWERFREFIRQGLVYLARDGVSGETLATFRVEWSGGALWDNDEQPAGYLYTLALPPRHIGRGHGVEIVCWLKKFFLQRDRRFFRLDCIASNERLRHWYESLGFQYRRTVQEGAYVLALYELDLSVGDQE